VVNFVTISLVFSYSLANKMEDETKKRCGRPTKSRTRGQPYSRPQRDVKQSCDFESLTVDDLDCPICIEMVTEPVRLRCNHLLCRECFERLVELSSRKCPKCRRWIIGTRRITEWLDSELGEFIRKKFLGPPAPPQEAVEEQIKSDRRLALALRRQERRERFFRRSSYTLRSSSRSNSLNNTSTSSSEDIVAAAADTQ